MSYCLKSEEKWIPDLLTTWTVIGTIPVNMTRIFKINNYLYAFGGYNASHTYVDKIYRTLWNDPIGWVDTGATCSVGGNVASGIVNNNIYSWGSTTQSAIWSAPISDPLTWSNTGSTFPSVRDNVPTVITPTHIIISAGYNGSALGNSAYASVNTPTSFSTGGSVNGWERGGFYLDGEEIYITPGFNGYAITGIHSKAPASVLFSNSITPTWGTDTPFFHVGEYIYAIGGDTTKNMYFTKIKNAGALTWAKSGDVLPANARYIGGCHWIGPDGYAYYVAYDSLNINRSERRKIYVTDPQIPGGQYSHRRAIYADTGALTMYTINCQMGMAPWYTNRRDQF